ncbi:hypothetical protein GCM10027417_12050 [Glutamicibacter endophyticus]
MKFTRRTLAAGLAAAVLLPLVPTTAFAAPPGSDGADRSFTEHRVWFEGFDQGTIPRGWSVNHENTEGMAQGWEGFTLHTRDEFVQRWGTDLRQSFTRAAGPMAVVESDQNAPANGLFSSHMKTPMIPVEAGGTYELRFDSHYRQGRGKQRADVVMNMPGQRPQTVLNYDRSSASDNAGKDVASKREVVRFTVPQGVKKVNFEFNYRDSANNWFWAIDNVEVVAPLPETSAKPTGVLDVVSDIQGATGNRHLTDNALPLLNSLPDPADALMINGDIVSQGSTANWEAFTQALESSQGHDSGQIFYANGNHEFYGREGSQTYLQRFLKYTEQDKVWQEQMIGETPMLVIGSEGYDYNEKTGSGPFVEFSEAQLAWLEERLTYWKSRNKPVLLFSHYVLDNSVSGTFINFYRDDFGPHREKFKQLLADNPNVVLFTSHTHWSLRLDDWAAEYHGGADAQHTKRGPMVVNTGALANEYTLGGDYGEVALPGERASGLRVKTFDDRIRVEAWDFISQELIKSIDIPVPNQR